MSARRNNDAGEPEGDLWGAILRAATEYSVIGTDVDGTITVFNVGAERMLGHSGDDVVGKTTPALIHVPEEVAERAAELGIEAGFEVFVAAARRGESETREWTYVRKDGTRLPVSLTVTAVTDETGRLRGFLGIARDVSDEQRARDELRAAVEQFKNVLARNPMPTVISRIEDGTVLYVNAAFVELLGYEEVDLVGRPFGALDIWVHPEERARMVDRLRSEGRIKGLEALLRAKDGTMSQVLASVEPIELEGEHCLIGVFHDITERAGSEREIERLNQQLMSILAAAGVGIFGLDRDGRCTFVNPAAASALGYATSELLGQVMHDVVHHSHEDGSPYPVTECPATRTLEQGTAVRVSSEVMWRSDGTSFPVEYTSHPILEDGAVTGAVVVFRDVTEQHRADELIRAQLRTLMEQADLLDLTHDSIIVRDLDGQIVFWNQGAERTYGWSRAEAVGQISHILLQTEFPEPITEIDRVLRDDGQWSGRLVQTRRDGRRLVVAGRWSLRVDRTGAPDAVLEIDTDVSAADEAEQAVVAARLEAEQANQTKSEFLSRMSHELRTPLNAILGFGQLLEMENLDAGQRDSVQHIVAAGCHLLDLINEVLDISRIESGRLQLSLESVRIADVVEEAIGMVRPLAAARAVGIVDETGNGEAHVRADSQRLKQIVLNLLVNAVKYNRDGGGITVRCEAGEEGRVRLVVTDTGIGIAEHDLARLFVPFERLGGEQSGVEGTGLGLTLTKRLVDAMGGDVAVRSEIGRGSSFSVELPAVDAPYDEPHAALPADRAGAPVRSSAAATTVLYVEDNLANVKLMERILARRPEVRLLVAMQGSLALDLAREHRPSLVLLDLNLPDVSGEEVLRRLLADPATADTPVVVISGDAMPGQMARLRALGATDYITKPFDVPRLLAVVDSVV